MQIVRDLAGYSYGRSDLVRRAMSKKKADVMARERQNFVYGNAAENVPGCVAKGISEDTANKIFDEMTDFAKYAFNKAHATAYAVVSFETAYLKTYYPVEFMAALMTSMIDRWDKVAQYIFICRQMGITLLPPDINEGFGSFTASGNSIRFALSAIKGVGKGVVDEIVRERKANGPYTSIKDFIVRMSSKEANKRVIENLIKSGAFDSIPGTRRQLMMVYAQIIDDTATERKRELTGQMSFFDYVDDPGFKAEEVHLPNIPDYTEAEILNLEKEALGIYISGHPLNAYKNILDKNVTAQSIDFIVDDETGYPKIPDEKEVVIGGIITNKQLKTTRSNTVMAFLTIEDLYGYVEVLVFPKDFEKHRTDFEPDSRVLIKGRASVEEEKDAKLIFRDIVSMDGIERNLWIKFPDKEAFAAAEQKLIEIVSKYDGNDTVTVYCDKEHAMKQMPKSLSTQASGELLALLGEQFGSDNIKVTDKAVEWRHT